MRVSLANAKALVRGIFKELCFLKRRLLGEKNIKIFEIDRFANFIVHTLNTRV